MDSETLINMIDVRERDSLEELFKRADTDSIHFQTELLASWFSNPHKLKSIITTTFRESCHLVKLIIKSKQHKYSDAQHKIAVIKFIHYLAQSNYGENRVISASQLLCTLPKRLPFCLDISDDYKSLANFSVSVEDINFPKIAEMAFSNNSYENELFIQVILNQLINDVNTTTKIDNIIKNILDMFISHCNSGTATINESQKLFITELVNKLSPSACDEIFSIYLSHTKSAITKNEDTKPEAKASLMDETNDKMREKMLMVIQTIARTSFIEDVSILRDFAPCKFLIDDLVIAIYNKYMQLEDKISLLLDNLDSKNMTRIQIIFLQHLSEAGQLSLLETILSENPDHQLHSHPHIIVNTLTLLNLLVDKITDQQWITLLSRLTSYLTADVTNENPISLISINLLLWLVDKQKENMAAHSMPNGYSFFQPSEPSASSNHDSAVTASPLATAINKHLAGIRKVHEEHQEQQKRCEVTRVFLATVDQQLKSTVFEQQLLSTPIKKMAVSEVKMSMGH